MSKSESADLGGLLRALLATCLAGIALHAAWLAGLGKGEIDAFVDEWAYNGVLVLAAAICLLRAAAEAHGRWAWLCFGLGLSAWTAGDIYWTVELADVPGRKQPYPSWADAGYLAAYPFMYAGIIALTRQRVNLSGAAWLDGAIGGLATAALGTAVLAPAFVGLTEGETAVVATNLSYPLGDALLLAFVILGIAMIGLRAGRSWFLLAAGIGVWAIADGIYLYQTATTSYDGGYLDSLWLIGGVLIAAAAVFAPARAGSKASVHSVAMPIVFSLVAIGVLAWDHFERLNQFALWFAVATLVGVALRLLLSFRENASLLRAVHEEAVTDALTGLGNRRQVLFDLEEATGGLRGEVVFVIFDLDGFKAYNDGFGHPAGDLLLRRLGRELERAVGPDGAAYRLGGDEFCVLVSGGEGEIDAIVSASREALSERGEGFSITASAGAALLPVEATTSSEALRLADTRMYSMKGQRPNSAQRQTHDVLVRVLREREPALSAHLRGTTTLSVETGKLVGLDAEELDVLRRAAELHDVGKIAIPDRILHKPGPLDAAEWELMRSHTTIGERILSAAPAMAPVARLVRATHERWDGAGYPDGLAGEQIPLGARIIFICDAFEAMTSDRSYRTAVDPEAALAELRRCAGSQFDSRLVELFATRVYPLLGSDAAGRVASGADLAASASEVD